MGVILLKKIVNNQNKWVIGLLCTAVFTVFYKITGVISYQSGVILPFIEMEKEIPFIPDVIWIYLILSIMYFFIAIYRTQNVQSLNRMFFGFLIITLITSALYIVLPLIYPFEYYPILANTKTNRLILLFRSTMGASNCFPSYQTSFCFLIAYIQIAESKWKFLLFFFISLILSLLTLILKLHYLYDLVGGIILASVMAMILSRIKFSNTATR